MKRIRASDIFCNERPFACTFYNNLSFYRTSNWRMIIQKLAEGLSVGERLASLLFRIVLRKDNGKI